MRAAAIRGSAPTTRAVITALAFLPLPPSTVLAQFATGSVYGVVATETGAVLPAVDVRLTSDAGNRATVSGPSGRFRFLELPRGPYVLTLSSPGFATLKREVQVVTGENVELSLTMTLSPLEETVFVTAETPLVDTRSQGTSTTLTAQELDRVPTSRSPWAVVRSVPGVITDRVNVAGSEDNSQTSIASKGTAWETWTVDGISFTDMRWTGGSQSYFEFGAIDEIAVRTGGEDLRVRGGGVGIHVTVKRGTNAFHGGARFLLTHDSLSSSNLPDELRDDPRLDGSDKADHLQQLSDYGFDLSGPILRDRLWLFASWGRQDVRVRDITQVQDRTLIDGWNAKLNWQATARTMVSGLWFMGDKRKYNRSPFPSLVVEDSLRWDQKREPVEGGLPPGLWKLQVDHTFSPSLFFSLKAAQLDAGFGLQPQGNWDQSYTQDFFRGEALGTSYGTRQLHPATTFSLDGSGFFDALGGSHEVKFGVGYRRAPSSYVTSYPGSQLVGRIFGPEDYVARVHRDQVLEQRGQYRSAYLGDVFTRGRLTLSLGLRWDGQGARNMPSEAPANASFPELLPALSYSGDAEDLVSWSNVSPRVGLSLALGDGRRTVVRASYADYAQQLPIYYVADENPMLQSLLAYAWNDLNGDRFVQPEEVLLDQLLYSQNVDPNNPGEIGEPVARVDRNLRNQRHRELVIGLDRELAPSLAAGIAYTWRTIREFPYWPYLGGECGDPPTAATCPIPGPETYTANPPLAANGYTAFTYSPDPELLAAGGFGWIVTNSPGYSPRFSGLELTLTRRLSRGWMGRVAFSWNDWVTRYAGTPVSHLGNPGPTRDAPLVEGGQVTLVGKTDVYSSVKWQLYANAMVELPWDLELAGALFARQGHPYPKFLNLRAGLDGRLQALAQPEVDTDRYDNVWLLDLRLAKHVRFRRAALTFSAELFNTLNSGVALRRNGDASAETFNRIDHLINPRILRFGVRLAF